MSEAVREPRRWSFWFIASLCLNFFLIGVIVMGLIVARNRSIAAAVSGGAAGGMRPEIVLQLLPRSGAIKPARRFPLSRARPQPAPRSACKRSRSAGRF